MARNRLLRMDNVRIVVEPFNETILFFEELGLKLEGRSTIEGEWAGRVTGLAVQRVEIAMMVTPDGHSTRNHIGRAAFAGPKVSSSGLQSNRVVNECWNQHLMN